MSKPSSNGELVAVSMGVLLWIATVVLELAAIWLPSWQWGATGVVTLVVGTLLILLATADS